MNIFSKQKALKTNNEIENLDLRDPIHLLAFGFGAGLTPKMPGTVGTVVAIPFCLLLNLFPYLVYMLATFLAAVVGVYICGKTARDIGVHDHKGIVWDEIAGYLITMLFVPLTVINVVLGFLLFRLFDIWKPWPIRWCDRSVEGGLGIMLDDLLAGVAAALVLHAILATGLLVS